jgi:ATP-dependent Clp protease ATP-binding subunit ClpA
MQISSLKSSAPGTLTFEKCTEQCRRAIFFAQYEALVRDWMHIEPEHLALGMLREAVSAVRRPWPPAVASAEDLKLRLEQSLAPPVPGRTYDAGATIPLSTEAKSAILASMAFSARMGHQHVGLEHLLVGLVSYERTFWSKIAGGFVLRAYLAKQGFDQLTLEAHARAVNAPD